MREINSASVEQLTSTGLVELRDLIAQARQQRDQVQADLAEATEALNDQSTELDRRKASWFRFFYRHRIADLEASVPEIEAEVARLTEWQEATHIDISFETGTLAQQAYGSLVRTFDALRACTRIWDVTSDRATDRVAERTAASRMLVRTSVRLDFAGSDLVRFSGQAMRFQNINGEDILIYPGMMVMPREDGAFALIDLREVSLEYNPLEFVERETVPSDTTLVGQVWAKTNKNGSRDMRFRDNYQIPVCLYGQLLFTSPGGVKEEYQASNSITAGEFAVAFAKYQVALETM